ncbi:aspartate--ammonia ligase, partial [Kipferlia bialata]
ERDVQSLAKWKRQALARYGLPTAKYQGIVTDMQAIRPCEESLDAIHSCYVDQWDWEAVIGDSDRTLDTLKDTVTKIYSALVTVERDFTEAFSGCVHPAYLPEEIEFVHTEDLEDMYPLSTPREREDAIAKKHGAVFIIGIGHPLPISGETHDVRSPDYDDWITPTFHEGKPYTGLNGDLIVYNPILKRSFEVSSMGIRVSPETLVAQLEMQGCTDRLHMQWHKDLLAGAFPASIGGGIGQSRLCQLLMRCQHIGEVQSSVWPSDVADECAGRGVTLL